MSYFDTFKELMFCCFLFIWNVLSEIYLFLSSVIFAFIHLFCNR